MQRRRNGPESNYTSVEKEALPEEQQASATLLALSYALLVCRRGLSPPRGCRCRMFSGPFVGRCNPPVDVPSKLAPSSPTRRPVVGIVAAPRRTVIARSLLQQELVIVWSRLWLRRQGCPRRERETVFPLEEGLASPGFYTAGRFGFLFWFSFAVCSFLWFVVA